MRRRDFISILGSVATWPFGASAQQASKPVVGFLNSRASGADPFLLEAFRQGLKEAGYIEGENVVIEYRFADNRYERLPELAADLVHRQVAVIVANGPAATVAKTASGSIPLVFATGFDPVQQGLVASLARPSGNATGVVASFDEIGPKKLELAHELVPSATDFAALLNPTYPSTPNQSEDLKSAAQRLGPQLHAGASGQCAQLFAATVEEWIVANHKRASGLFGHTTQHAINVLAAAGIPSIFQNREFAAAGGLISYGPSLVQSKADIRRTRLASSMFIHGQPMLARIRASNCLNVGIMSGAPSETLRHAREHIRKRPAPAIKP
jgi:putative tryptophan/tyrosine transport system substrate-binding protein